jgi:hypothetical protein
MLSKVIYKFSLINIEVELTEDSKGNFSYKEVSEISDVTEESYPEGLT